MVLDVTSPCSAYSASLNVCVYARLERKWILMAHLVTHLDRKLDMKVNLGKKTRFMAEQKFAFISNFQFSDVSRVEN